MNYSIKLIIIIFVVAIALTIPSQAETGSVVFDNSVGFFGINSESNAGMSGLAEQLEFDGYSVSETIQTYDDSSCITEPLLNSADILVIINPRRPFSFEEIKLIEKYVSEGNALLLVCDIPESTKYMNRLSGRFGASFLSYYLGGLTVDSSLGKIQFTSPIPLELDEEPDIEIKYNCSAGKWESRWIIPEKSEEGNFTIFSGLGHEEGMVVFLGDSSILMNENIEQNEEFLSAVFSFLSKEIGSSELTYIPGAVETCASEGKKGITVITVENKGENNETLEIKVPVEFQEIIRVSPEILTIEPGEAGRIKVTTKWTDGYSEFSDFLIVERTSGFAKNTDYIKFTVSFL